MNESDNHGRDIRIEEALKSFNEAQNIQADFTIEKFIRGLSMEVSVRDACEGCREYTHVHVSLYYESRLIAEADD